MTKTAVKLYFGMFNPNLKQATTFAATGALANYSDLEDLKLNRGVHAPISTLEDNYWLLDGTYALSYPVAADNLAYFYLGFLSSYISNSSSLFVAGNRPILTLTLTTASDIDGLTFVFNRVAGSWATSFEVIYTHGNATTTTKTYTNAEYSYSTNDPILSVKSLQITFLASNKPLQRLQIVAFDFGNAIQLAGTDIKDAVVTTLVDPISATLPFSTADVRVITTDPAFSVMTPDAEYMSLYERQPISIWETVDNVDFFIGEYFLDTWEAESENVLSMHFVDAIGLMDSFQRPGRILGTDTFSDNVSLVMGADFPYEVGSALASTSLTGNLQKGTLRQQLQQLAFAAGAMAVMHNGVIRFEASPALATATEDATILLARIGFDTKVVLKPLITGVDLTSYAWTAATNVTNLYSGTVPANSSVDITWSTLIASATITGCTYTDLTGTGVTLVNSTGSPVSATVTGHAAVGEKTVYNITNTNLPVTTKPNVPVIDSSTMMNSTYASAAVTRVYDYLNYRHKMTTKLVAPTERPGQVVITDTIQSKQIKGTIERMVMNLSGGFVTTTEITGVLYGVV